MRFLTLLIAVLFVSTATAAESTYRSHPALRTPPKTSNRPMGKGPALFVDPGKGDDKNDGSQEAPWTTVAHALKHLSPGTTLYLRGGVYREQVRISLHGKADRPITIRAYPGEAVVLDGGIAEFFDSPQTAWKPIPGGAKGEYRSVRRYPNLREVMGWFGDSMVGLNTYYYAKDLRSTNEVVSRPEGSDPRKTDIDPLYCGPGLWYDKETGYIHVRLAHTHLPKDVANYRGETDPRKLPLVIAPFRSTPLFIDGAQHVRVQDLTVRGGGYDATAIDLGTDITFDNLTIWCGSYGLRAARALNLKIVNCGFYGSCPPWLFRGDTSKRAYPGRPLRDITRLNTHSHLVTEAGREFSIYAHPVNDEWEIANCEFTDAHDGPYLGGVSVKFHHNLIDDTQDDGIYLSQMYPRHLYWGKGARIEIYENVFRGCLTALAFGGPEDTRDEIFIYRNIFDLRKPVWTGRPTKTRKTLGMNYGRVMGDHGGPPWPKMNIYHNTFVMRQPARFADMVTLTHVRPEHPRRVFNNVFLHLTRLPGYGRPDAEQGVVADGNLYWTTGTPPKSKEAFFQRYRGSKQFTASKTTYAPGTTSNSLVADPKFYSVVVDAEKANDYRPKAGSPVINAGVPLPKEWPDSLRKADGGKPDIGALPAGGRMFYAGRKPAGKRE